MFQDLGWSFCYTGCLWKAVAFICLGWL